MKETPIAAMCAARSDSIRRVMEIMDASRNAFALVVEPDGKLVGTISDGDIRRGILAGLTLQSTAAEVMNVRFSAASPSTGRAEALDVMKARSFRHLPVVDAAGKLVGIHLLRELIGAVERPYWAVLMVGGKGTRLWPLTHNIPKPMIPVAGRPILERLVLHLVGFGIKRIYMAVHYLGHMIEDHFGNGEKHGCEIHYLHETKPLGTGGALTLLPETPTRPILVMNGDLVTQADIGQLFDQHERDGNKLTLATRDHVHTVPYGVVSTEGRRIVSVQEKPTHSWTINAGMYVIDPSLLARIPPGEDYPLPRLIEDCLAAGEQVGAFNIEDQWLDVGQHAELERALGRTP